MIIISFVIICPIILLNYFSYTYFFNKIIEKISSFNNEQALPFISYLEEIDERVRLWIYIGTFLVILFNSVIFLFLSHSIAGPIEKLKNHLIKKEKKIETGPFVIRESDFFPEIAPIVNKAFNDDLN